MDKDLSHAIRIDEIPHLVGTTHAGAPMIVTAHMCVRNASSESNPSARVPST